MPKYTPMQLWKDIKWDAKSIWCAHFHKRHHFTATSKVRGKIFEHGHCDKCGRYWTKFK